MQKYSSSACLQGILFVIIFCHFIDILLMGDNFFHKQVYSLQFTNLGFDWSYKCPQMTNSSFIIIFWRLQASWMRKNAGNVKDNGSNRVMQHTAAKLQNTYGSQKKIPIGVHIASWHVVIRPQYAGTLVKWVMLLVRSLSPYAIPDIPIWCQTEQDESLEQQITNNKLYIYNWTRGSQFGRCISEQSTIASLLLKKQDKSIQYPEIRIQWDADNEQTYKVEVDLHNLLVFHYSSLTIFHKFEDLFEAVKEETVRTLKLKQLVEFELKVSGKHEQAQSTDYVDGCFRLGVVNKVFLVVVFREVCSLKIAKEKYPDSYESLICPITQLMMQKPVTTPCQHTFDILAIKLSLIQQQICPLCRSPISINQKLKVHLKYSNQIKKIKQLTIEQSIKNFEQNQLVQQLELEYKRKKQQQWAEEELREERNGTRKRHAICFDY